MIPEQYITDNNLWDIERLKRHAQDNSVYVIESLRFPNVVMLHYQDSCTYSNSWNEFSRMSRGLILDMKNKKVLAYPFDKFFNLGQMPETTYENLVSLGGFQTSEKLDGSMVIAFIDPNTNLVTFTTKGSFDSEHGLYANTLPLLKEYNYKAFEVYTRTGTLIFELVTKRFQIVIDYQKKGYEEGLYLIGYRDHTSGKLISFMALKGIAEELGVPTFKTYSFDSLNALIEASNGLPVTEEGFVLRFSNDLLVKVKGPKYLEMHRFISNLSDRNILKAVVNNVSEELLAVCPDEFVNEVSIKIRGFKNRLAELSNICYTKYEIAPKGSRKEFATWVGINIESYLKSFLFNLLDGKPLDEKRLYKVIEIIDCVDGKTRI